MHVVQVSHCKLQWATTSGISTQSRHCPRLGKPPSLPVTHVHGPTIQDTLFLLVVHVCECTCRSTAKSWRGNLQGGRALCRRLCFAQYIFTQVSGSNISVSGCRRWCAFSGDMGEEHVTASRNIHMFATRAKLRTWIARRQYPTCRPRSSMPVKNPAVVPAVFPGSG